MEILLLHETLSIFLFRSKSSLRLRSPCGAQDEFLLAATAPELEEACQAGSAYRASGDPRGLKGFKEHTSPEAKLQQSELRRRLSPSGCRLFQRNLPLPELPGFSFDFPKAISGSRLRGSDTARQAFSDRKPFPWPLDRCGQPVCPWWSFWPHSGRPPRPLCSRGGTSGPLDPRR